MLLGMRQGPFGDPSPVINWDFLQSQSLTSFSRTSNATLFDSTGKLTYAANNLLLNSATLSTQTVTAGLQAGVSVILSFSGTGSVAISGGYTGSLAGTGVSDRVALKFTTTTNSLTFTVTGSVTSAQLEVVTYQTTPSTYVATTANPYYGPRYPYAYNGTTWDAQGLLVEAAATNLALQSSAMAINNAWLAADGVKGNDGTLSSDGVTLMAKVANAPGTNSVQLYSASTVSITANEIYTCSVEVKAGTNTYPVINMQGSVNNWASAVFDISTTSNGVASQTAGGSSSGAVISTSKTYIGDGKFRLSLTGRVNNSSMYIVFDIAKAATGNTFTNGGQPMGSTFTGTETIYVAFAQLEAGAPATSYIPTTSASVTRNSDTSLAFSALSLPTGLSFSRTSNAMQYDAAGRLTYAPNNLLTYSNTFSDSSWSKTAAGNGVVPTVTDGYAIAPDGTQTAARIQFSLGAGGSSGSRLYRSISTTSTLLGSIWFKTNDGSTKTLYVQSGGAPIAVTVTGTWTQFASTPGATYSQMQFGLQDGAYNGVTTSNTADVLVWSAVSAAVTYETVPRPCDQIITTTDPYYGPRYDYDPVTRLPKGLLIEEARTNRIYPSSINASWNAVGSLTPSYDDSGTLAPDGTQTATLLTATGANGYIQITAGVATGSNVAKTSSVWIKRKTGTGGIDIVDNGLTAWHAVTLGSGWTRVSYYNATPSTANNGGIRIQTNGDAVWVWGYQVEDGSFPTSYIPTTSVSVQRTADVATLTGTALTTLAGNTVSFVQEQNLFGLSAYSNLISAAASSSDKYSIFLDDAGGSPTGIFKLGYNGAVINPGSIGDVRTTFRAAAAFNTASASIVINGGAVATGATTFASGINSALISSNGTGSNKTSMWIRKFAAWNVKLADAKLQTKSVVGATL